MAEGHAVVRWARELQPLIGELLERVDAPPRWAARAAALVGSSIASIDTHGKHLLLNASGGETIHCHAMMFGSWQTGRTGMKLRKPEKQVRLRLRTREHEAVFFNGSVVEILTAPERRRHPRLRALGPDVMKPDFDREEARRRMSTAGSRAIGDAILDQTLVAGIGNIFKCEALFLAGIHPERRTDTLDREELERLWDAVIPLMHEAARAPGAIVTLPRALRRGAQVNWVYWRSGRPCFRCSTAIRSTRQGEMNRVTFYCPECQPLDPQRQGSKR